MTSARASIHIIAMGPAQLLTAIAALRARGNDAVGAKVFYRGIPSETIDAVMEKFCGAFQVQYAGLANVNTSVPGRRGFEGVIDRWRARVSPRNYLNRRLAWVRSELDSLRAETMVIAVRHNVPEDLFLLAALRPERVLFTADGVIVGAPHSHAFRTAERIALGSFGNPYPMSCDVWTPAHLQSFAAKVGRPRIIPDEIFREVLIQAQAVSATLAPKGCQVIVLGQHLNLSGLTTEFEELTIWSDILHHLGKRFPEATVLYKAHPRDRKMKRLLLTRLLPEGAQVRFTTDENWALPLEAMPLTAGTQVFGLSSSALLYAEAQGHLAKRLCGRHWPDSLVSEIFRFGAESALPIEWIDED